MKLAAEGVTSDNDRASQDQRWTPEDWAAIQPAGGIAGNGSSGS